MSVTTIKEGELRRMKGEEGLVLQGCGGDLDEWVTGINDMLTEEGILLEGTRINDCKSFTHDNLTSLLFPFKDAKLDIGKFAIWRLKTHSQFGGMWLSDYVPNRLGGFLEETPIHKEKLDCPLIGADGNIFNLVGIASRTLKRNGLGDDAKEMTSRVFSSSSYEEALGIIGEYVNITGIGEEENMDGGMMPEM